MNRSCLLWTQIATGVRQQQSIVRRLRSFHQVFPLLKHHVVKQNHPLHCRSVSTWGTNYNQEQRATKAPRETLLERRRNLLFVRTLTSSQNKNNNSNNNTATKTTPTATPFDQAVAFVVKVGYDQQVARGVVEALKESGLSGEGLLTTTKALAGRWEVGEDEGLEALAASVVQQLKAQRNTAIVTIKIVPGNAWNSGDDQEDDIVDEEPVFATSQAWQQQRAFTVQAYEGMSLTDVAKFGTLPGANTLGEYLECACSGIMACSTCHVVVDGEWKDRVGLAGEDEQDMIDLAYGPRPTSRLGCQIVLTQELDGLVLWLPKGQNNLMDHIPFEG